MKLCGGGGLRCCQRPSDVSTEIGDFCMTCWLSKIYHAHKILNAEREWRDRTESAPVATQGDTTP